MGVFRFAGDYYGVRGNQIERAIATGGTTQELGGYKIHTFNVVGSDSFSVLNNLNQVEYLMVAGGGAGGVTTQVAVAVQEDF